jgi:iron complex transport system substrate-binding protein
LKTPVILLAALLAGPARVEPGQTPRAATIVDSLGRAVAVPAKVERIISLEPEITRIIVALGAGDRLVGLDFFLRNHDHLFPLAFPAAGDLPVVSNPAQELNYEQAIRLRPDIIFTSPSEFRMTESIERRMRVPVVALASMGKLAALVAELATVGRLLGREDRAAALTAFFESRLDAVRRSVASVPEDRPSVYLAFWGSLVRTPVAYEPIEAAGGRNAAAGLLPDRFGAAGATISVEKLLALDPDVILVQGNYLPAERQVTVEGVLRDPRLRSLRAVRSGRVHYTFGFWYWWDPALVLIETLYLTRVFRPQASPGPDLIQEGDAIFKEFYGAEGMFGAFCRVLGCHEWTAR